MSQYGLYDEHVLEIWRKEAPSISPSWVVVGYLDTRGKKPIAPVYVRAASGRRALDWCERNRMLVGWHGKKIKRHLVRPAHPEHDLGMRSSVKM